MIPSSVRAAVTALLFATTGAASATMPDGQCPPPPACPVCPACPTAPIEVPPAPPARPLQPAAWSELVGWAADDHAQAWPALQQSCAALSARPYWQPVCMAADMVGNQPSSADARTFFETWFVPWVAVNTDGSREGMVTGYYEPVIKGSRTPSSAFRHPVHAPPPDMLTVDLGDTHPDLRHMRLRGRLEGNRVVPYWTRGEIGSLGGDFSAPVLFWAADPVELFFLHVQGSGQLELPDGSRVRIGYADQNGHPYASIGRWLIERGEMNLENASMQGIRSWARRNPERLGELLAANPSYVFFRELTQLSGGPIGALGVPLTAGRSIAADPQRIPLGVPVFLATTHPLSERPLRRLMLAQDTGSAIKGAVRADFYWGTGPQAGEQAGRMRQTGRMWALLPRGMTPAE